MPDNPSVVNEGGNSNYSLSRTGGMAKADADYIDKLQKSFQNPAPGDLGKSTYYPSADRGIQAGTFGSKSLGNIPIFTAGQGLLPIGMLDAKKKAEQQAAIQEFAMFGPENNEALYQYIELANPYAQDAFNAKIQGEINTYLDEMAAQVGGDYSKARLMAKYDPAFKNMIRTYDNYARAYNQLYPKALDVLKRAADPVNNYVDEETVEKATKFIRNHDNISVKDIRELTQYLGEFEAYMGIDEAVQMAVSQVGKRITTTLDERIDFSTNANKVFETVEKTGFYTKDEMDIMIDTAMESYPYLANDPKAKAQFEKKFRAGITQTETKTIQAVRREYAQRQRDVNQSFGLMGNDDRGYVATQVPKYTDDGQREYDTHQITIPAVNGQKRATYLDISPNDILSVRDSKGNVLRGYFNVPLKSRPTNMYKDLDDKLQVSSTLDIQAMIDYVDPDTGAAKGLKKAEAFFNVVGPTDGEQTIDVIDLGGSAEIIIPEERLTGQFTTQFGNDVWGQVVKSASKTPTPKSKPRKEGGRNKFITLEEATEDQKAWSKSKRQRQAREGFAERKKETGLGTYIVEDLEIKNAAGKWVPYAEVVARGIKNGQWTEEDIRRNLNDGTTTDFRVKSE